LPVFSGGTLTLLMGLLLSKELVMKIAFKVFLFFLSIMVAVLRFGLRVIALMRPLPDSETENKFFFFDGQKKGYDYNEVGDITYDGYPIDD
jgi:hypothetical protein